MTQHVIVDVVVNAKACASGKAGRTIVARPPATDASRLSPSVTLTGDVAAPERRLPVGHARLPAELNVAVALPSAFAVTEHPAGCAASATVTFLMVVPLTPATATAEKQSMAAVT